MEPKEAITIRTRIKAPLLLVWDFLTLPEHIVEWNSASDDWHTVRATNELFTGGKFTFRMEAKDGSFGFDFGGTYDEVKPFIGYRYTLGDGRRVEVTLSEAGGLTEVVETFDPENENPPDMQRAGWQAILDHLKRYSESRMEV